jgi:hypothetical protein
VTSGKSRRDHVDMRAAAAAIELSHRRPSTLRCVTDDDPPASMR